ncbi:SCO4402 family protein [Nocardia asteroides]|uniref:SCO4402 family protein n=1 Tax=Nocardia asteroides TaxID=1824 RepID=UPI003665AD01
MPPYLYSSEWLMGSTMTGVRYPEMRKSVMEALESFADSDYQRRVWIDREFPQEGFYDDLDVNVSILYDDCVVVPDPRSRIGTVLVDGPEVYRLIELDQVLGPMIRRLGDAPDATYLGDTEWPLVVAAALATLAAMRDM